MRIKRGRIGYMSEQKQGILARLMLPQNEAVAESHEETKTTEAILYNGGKKHVHR